MYSSYRRSRTKGGARAVEPTLIAATPFLCFVESDHKKMLPPPANNQISCPTLGAPGIAKRLHASVCSLRAPHPPRSPRFAALSCYTVLLITPTGRGVAYLQTFRPSSPRSLLNRPRSFRCCCSRLLKIPASLEWRQMSQGTSLKMVLFALLAPIPVLPALQRVPSSHGC